MLDLVWTIYAQPPDGQQFALNQFRSPAYNLYVGVTRSENIKLSPVIDKAAVNL
jgi:hypothetical protein